MTLSPLRNVTVGALALIYTTLTFAAATAPTPAMAQTGAFYTAELAAPAKTANTVVNGVVWQCAGTSCVAPKSNSRPVITCARLAREVGEVTSFTARGEALSQEQIASCNGK